MTRRKVKRKAPKVAKSTPNVVDPPAPAKPKRKGGIERKPVTGVTRSMYLVVRVSVEERESVRKMCKAARLGLADFVRHRVFGYPAKATQGPARRLAELLGVDVRDARAHPWPGDLWGPPRSTPLTVQKSRRIDYLYVTDVEHRAAWSIATAILGPSVETLTFDRGGWDAFCEGHELVVLARARTAYRAHVRSFLGSLALPKGTV